MPGSWDKKRKRSSWLRGRHDPKMMTTFRIPNRWFSLHFHDFVGECSPAGTFDLYVALLSLKPQIPTRIILFGCPIDYPTLLIGLKTGHQTGSAESTWNPTPSIFVRCLVRDADDPRHGFPRERQGSFPCRWGFPAMPPCVSPSLPPRLKGVAAARGVVPRETKPPSH